MTTVVIQIGNSDDKLTQQDWAAFCAAVWAGVQLFAKQIHFEGYSPGAAPWQNACWVAEVDPPNLKGLRGELRALAARYGQDSIALTLGMTEMVEFE